MLPLCFESAESVSELGLAVGKGEVKFFLAGSEKRCFGHQGIDLRLPSIMGFVGTKSLIFLLERIHVVAVYQRCSLLRKSSLWEPD